MRDGTSRRGLLGVGVGVGVVASVPMVPRAAVAQARPPEARFPDRPLRLVSPYATGSTSDNLSRGLAIRLGQELGQPVVVENRVGGGGIVGTVHVQQSEPNGYTLLLTTEATIETLPIIKRGVGYDPDRDFDLLSIMNETPWIIVAAPRLGASGLADLVRIGRARPDGLTYSSAGVGTGAHIAGEVFGMATGIPMTGVHFGGSVPALTALLSGQVPISFQVPSNVGDLVRTGQLRAIAVAAKQRLEDFPDVPTAAEGGFPQLDVSFWVGFAVSRRAPEAVRERLRAAIRRIAGDPGFQADMRRVGIVIAPPRTPEETARFIAANRERLAVLVRERGITLD